MFESITILEELDLLYKKLEIHISNIRKRNKIAPKGSLRIINKWNKHQYYHRINPSDPQGKYIPRKDQITAIRLAQKDYDNKALKALLTQQQAIGQFLTLYSPIDLRITEFYFVTRCQDVEAYPHRLYRSKPYQSAVSENLEAPLQLERSHRYIIIV